MAKNIRYTMSANTTDGWASANTCLLSGEPGFDMDANKLKVGDGLSTWSARAFLEMGLSDAPQDNHVYVRKNGAWATDDQPTYTIHFDKAMWGTVSCTYLSVVWVPLLSSFFAWGLYAGNGIYTMSRDGLSWSTGGTTFPALSETHNAYPICVVWASSIRKFIAIGAPCDDVETGIRTTPIYSSADGTSWTTIRTFTWDTTSETMSDAPSMLSWCEEEACLYGFQPTPSSRIICYKKSADGVVWGAWKETTLTNDYFYGLVGAFSNGSALFLGNRKLYSTSLGDCIFTTCDGICYDKFHSRWIVLADGKTLCSVDGASWDVLTDPPPRVSGGLHYFPWEKKVAAVNGYNPAWVLEGKCWNERTVTQPEGTHNYIAPTISAASDSMFVWCDSQNLAVLCPNN